MRNFMHALVRSWPVLTLRSSGMSDEDTAPKKSELMASQSRPRDTPDECAGAAPVHAFLQMYIRSIASSKL